MRFTFDSNILVYAMDEGSPVKRDVARDLLVRATEADAFLTSQVLGEFLHVMRRKFPIFFVGAIEEAQWLVDLFQVVGTTPEHMIAGAEFSARHKLQFWDSVLWQVARSAGAAIFLSEDMQDGFSLDGMTVLNPFSPANAGRLAELLAADAASA